MNVKWPVQREQRNNAHHPFPGAHRAAPMASSADPAIDFTASAAWRTADEVSAPPWTATAVEDSDDSNAPCSTASMPRSARE